jgi:hypothetical protein
VDLEQGQSVLRWAMALAMAQDSAGLKALGTRYGASMAGTTLDPGFRMLVGGAGTTAPRLDTIGAALAQADGFQTFLKNYRNALESGPRSGPG